MCESTTSTNKMSIEPSPSPSPTESICPLLNEHAFDCPICLELLVEPVTLQCGHTYCNHCISQWIVSHSLSKLTKKMKCSCPECKSVIYNRFKHTTSFKLRDFLSNQFTNKYKERYNNTHQLRIKCNKQLIKLQQIHQNELKKLQKCCGIIKLQKWLLYRMELLINPNLHSNMRSWLIQWLFIYIIIISALLPLIIPIIKHINISEKTKGVKLYFFDDIFEYLGLNTISKISMNTVSFVGSFIH
eukprot:555264_1